MKTLIEIAKEKGAQVIDEGDVIKSLINGVTITEAQLIAAHDAYCKQFEPIKALLLQDLTPTYCNDSGNIWGGKNHNLKDVYLAPQQIPSEVKEYIAQIEKALHEISSANWHFSMSRKIATAALASKPLKD